MNPEQDRPHDSIPTLKPYSGDTEELIPHKGETVKLWGLTIPALADQVARLMKDSFRKKVLLVVLPTALEAEDFVGDLEYFYPDGDISLLPGLDRSPFLQKYSGITGMGERLYAASKLLEGRGSVVVTSVPSILRKLPKPSFLKGRSLKVEEGMELPFESFPARLSEYGYRRVLQVENHGEFSVRGGIVDVYPVRRNRPVRVEFFGDFVESVREFLVGDQKSVGKIPYLVIGPIAAVPITKESTLEASKRLEKMAYKNNWLRALWEPVYHNLTTGGDFRDFENWTPLIEDNLVDFSVFLKESKAMVLLYETPEIKKAAESGFLGLRNHFSRLRREEIPHIPLNRLYEEPKTLLPGLMDTSGGLIEVSQFKILETQAQGKNVSNISFSIQSTSDLKMSLKTPGLNSSFLLPLVAKVRSLLGRNYRVNLVLRNKEQSKRLAEMLLDYDLSPLKAPKGVAPMVISKDGLTPHRSPRNPKSELIFSVGQLSEGFVATYENEAYIAEEEIFGSKRRTRKRASEEIRGLSGGLSLHDLSPGDYVVHTDYGIGQYHGLETKTMSTGYQGEFLAIEYKGGDMLYVPVETFGLVSKYVGANDRPPSLDRMGSANWERLKTKVHEDIRKQAEELLALYARRQMTPGFAYSQKDGDFLNFESAFPYDETPDQAKAIEEVLKDLGKANPMDRLVCGDVGFGKTEVAIRAAYKVVSDSKQVAVLVPTTILAEQHERTFKERFHDWPVNVGSISRLKKPMEVKETLKDLEVGKLDIVIGTQRLLQKDIKFKDLGLLVIDEEHRFGVAHKERLKKLKTDVDVLSMSATPIPRSLSMSMNGIRDLSLIQSPPVDRLSVQTSLVRCDDSIVVEAIERELERGGQVYFIHNRIADIQHWVKHLKELLPLVRFGVGHGKLKPNELEEIVTKFWKKEIDVWISTTIVESGLDFPDANTIIIDQANRFGLAQLYQLRGRVGRSTQQAYCYLMVDDPDTLSIDAKKRLQAIMENNELGSGYEVALHDLQIRGSGNVLGVAQHGSASLVGYELYTQMVEQAVSELKKEPVEEHYEPEIVLGLPAYLPFEYAPDTNARITLYRRLSRAQTLKELTDIEDELKDRFGKPPAAARNLLDMSMIKLLAKKIRAVRVERSSRGLRISFMEDPKKLKDTVLEKIIALMQDPTKTLEFTSKGELFVPAEMLNKNLGEIDAVKTVLYYLGKPEKAKESRAS
ncbi:MAG: transcription-repair coupling factor [Deltaproteobacteria bacterium]|jgi:transcription-repair coupling factor (superfamily II helicase)|nr:transcription-repair coupling factor [Deltaproteobacteria bacterium]